MRLLVFAVLLLSFASCYEDREGCLDPAATNFELRADEACPDCCTYPALSVRVNTVWGDSAYVAGETYQDGSDHDFQIVRFRYYLGDLRLESNAGDLTDPVRPVDLLTISGGDTLETIFGGNYLLASTTPTTTGVGTFTTGGLTVAGFSGSYGLADRYRSVIPASAPTGDALRTQPGRLNYRDERGYVQARLEYTLEPGGDTLSASSFGSLPFTLDFGDDFALTPGFNLRIDLEADLEALLGQITLSRDTTAVAAGLNQEPNFLRATALIQ